MKMILRYRYSSGFVSLVILSIYLVVLAAFDIGFYNRINLYNVAYAVSQMIPAVIGMQILLIVGFFDLSTGSIAALAGIITGVIASSTDFMILAVVVGCIVGACVGLINAFVVVKLHVSCLIATIATMGIVRGLALIVSDGSVVAGMPRQFEWLARWQFFGIEFPIFFGILATVIIAALMSASRPFRRFYQVGSNYWSAEICGINVNAVTIVAFVFSALGGALSGILGVSRTMAASPTSNETLALDTIAACVIGGSSLNGGRGTIVGALLGLAIIQITENVVVLAGISLYWRYVAIGLILAVVVILNNYLSPESKLLKNS